MPLVQVLPNTASTAAPGYTYVVDTGFDPSKAAFNPKDRKRVSHRPGGRRGENELSARQQGVIARRIADLNRDNDPKQVIAIPSNAKSIPAKTQNTRRILAYQRQIKHWLDEEDAMLQQAAQAPTNRPAAGHTLRRQSTFSRGTTMPPTPAEMTPVPTAAPEPTSSSVRLTADSKTEQLLSVDDILPPPLNQAELEALLAAPPLSYAASHAAAPTPDGPPQRRFCDNCGYWGKIKCLKCGARVCGLECKNAHEATRCLKWA
ncbi:hypothetical protein M011DRAFT_473311 [Sporormia fimetaria CBS 119925]|uniref:HIT-type domain-containing protein n=1 Tax=Sporormia fimetaria CBS 119925 TaxID=1340428 RepID=A0A6A6VR16_9PLEO|nr:hypothetical protein M011DRAFT_473311 [Sporormia fimetaria CBS 119925]